MGHPRLAHQKEYHDRDGPRLSLAKHRADTWGRSHTGLELAGQFLFGAASALLYFGVRGLTEGDVDDAVRHGYDLLRFEAFFGLDFEAALQGAVSEHRALVTAANWVYIWGHWPVIVATLVWLHRSHRDGYLLLRNAILVSGAIGLIIFTTYPVAPPRLIDAGFHDTVTELSDSYRVLQPPALVNKYAALPSLHVGWNLLVGIVMFGVARGIAARVFAVLGPILMVSAVVLTANHYVIDALAGAIVALAGLAIALRVTARRQAPRPVEGSKAQAS